MPRSGRPGSNASSELELDGTRGVRVGDEGRGIRTILDMVAATRLDCVLGSAATMRQALVRAVHHTRHRRAFGKALVDQPLMRNVLMDLALESEAATTLGLRLAAAVNDGDTAFSRPGAAELHLGRRRERQRPRRRPGSDARTRGRVGLHRRARPGTLQACLLARFAPAYVSDAFVQRRLGAGHGDTFGTLPGALVDASAGAVIERSFTHLTGRLHSEAGVGRE